VAEEKTAQGNVVVADAALRTAQINLGYTAITAPITGRIGRASVTRGNVVGPDNGSLALIVSQDPTYVLFPVSQREFLRIQKQEQAVDASKLKVRIVFADGSVYDQLGTIDFVDVSVDQATDTVAVRATVPNPRGILTDGELVRVSVEGEKPQERVLVPQAALLADQEGTYVFVVDNGKAAIRRLKLAGESGSDAVVEKGLSGGEQVIVQGMQSLQAGAPVTASPAAANRT
jgi:membrane fusion protein, multidrug efflux system